MSADSVYSRWSEKREEDETLRFISVLSPDNGNTGRKFDSYYIQVVGDTFRITVIIHTI